MERGLLRAGLWFDWPVAALTFAAFVGLFVAWHRQPALIAVLWYGAGALVYVLVSRLCQPGERWRAAAGVLILAGVALSAYVVLQFGYLGYEVKHPSVTGVGLAIGGLVPRVGSWAPMPNSVATFLEGIVPLALALALGRRTRGWRLVGTTGVPMLAAAVVLTASHGAWVALAAGGAVWVLAWASGRTGGVFRRLTAIVGIFVAALLFAAASTLVGPLDPGEWLGGVFFRPDRISVYRHSLSLISDFPFTGIGPGDQFAMALSRYALLIQVPYLTYAHNLLLSVWLELGLAGIVSWVALAGAIVGSAVAGEAARLGSRFRGAWAGTVVILVHGLFDARQSVDRWTWLPFFVLLGLAAARLRRGRVHAEASVVAVPVVFVLVFAGAAAPWLLPLRATWHANQGMIGEAHAELGDGTVQERARMLANARQRFEVALVLSPSHPTARRRLGVMAMDGEQFEAACEHLEVAWRGQPDNAASRKAFGLALTWAGRTEEAAGLLWPFPGIANELNTWSFYWEQRGRLAQAVHAVRVSLRIDPAQPQVAQRLSALEQRAAR